MWSQVIRAGYAIGGIIAGALTGVQIDRVSHGLRPGCDPGNCLKSLLTLPYYPSPRVVRSSIPSSKVHAGPDTTNITIRIADASNRSSFADSSVFTLLATNGDSEFDFYQSSNTNFTVIVVAPFIGPESVTPIDNGTEDPPANGPTAYAAFTRRLPQSLRTLVDFLHRSVRGWIWILAVFGLAWVPALCMASIWFQQQAKDFARIDAQGAMSMVPGLHREVTLRRKMQDQESEIFSLLAIINNSDRDSKAKDQRCATDLEALQKIAIEKESRLDLLKIEADEQHAKLAEYVSTLLAEKQEIREAHQEQLRELRAAFDGEKQRTEESNFKTKDQALVIKDLKENIEALEGVQKGVGQDHQKDRDILISERDSEISTIRAKLAKQVSLHNDLVKNVDGLREDKQKAIQSLESHQRALADSQRSLTNFESQSNKFTDRLREQVGASEARQTRVGQRCTQLEDEKGKMMLEKRTLEAENATFKAMAVRLESSEAKLNKENTDFETKLSDANSRFKVLQEAKDKLQDQLETISAEADGLQISKSATLKDNVRLNTELERLDTDLQTFKEHESRLVQRNSELNKEVDDLQDFRAQSRRKVKKLEGDFLALQHSTDRLEAKNTSLQQENEHRRSSGDLIKENTHLHETIKTQRDLIDRMEKAATKAAKRVSPATSGKDKDVTSKEAASAAIARPIVQLPPVDAEASPKPLSSTQYPPSIPVQPPVNTLASSASPTTTRKPSKSLASEFLPAALAVEAEVQTKGKLNEAHSPSSIPWGLKLDQRPDLPENTPTGPKTGRRALSSRPTSSEPSISSGMRLEPKDSAVHSHYQTYPAEQSLAKGKNLGKEKGGSLAKYDARTSFELQQKRMAEKKAAEVPTSTPSPLETPTKSALADPFSNKAFPQSQSPAEKRELVAHYNAKAEFELQQQQMAARKASQAASKASGLQVVSATPASAHVASSRPSLAPAAKGKGAAKYDTTASFALQQERMGAKHEARAPPSLPTPVAAPFSPGASSPSPTATAKLSAADSFARQQRLSSVPAPPPSISPSKSAPVVTRYPPPPGYLKPTRPVPPLLPSHQAYSTQTNVAATPFPFKASASAPTTNTHTTPHATNTNPSRKSQPSKPTLPAHLLRAQENDTIASPAESWYIERGMPIPDTFPENMRTGATRGPHAWYGKEKVASGPQEGKKHEEEEL